MIKFLARTWAGCRRTLPRHALSGIAALATSALAALVSQLIGMQPLYAKSSDRPNIVLIMADDLGYGHLGCYGQTKIRTPCIDRMAREGTRFTQVYAGHCVCAPSRSTLMTGYHTGHTSVRVNGGGAPLLPDDVTVAEVLTKAGYTTGIFGKWGLGDHGTTGVPYKQGFDEFFGYLHQVHAHFYYPWFLWHNDRRFELTENIGQKQRQYSHDVIVTQAMDFVRRNQKGPFFLYLPLTIPHFELLVPEDSLREYAGKFPEPEPYVDPRKHYADQPTPRAAFAAMVTRMDRDVGRLLELIQSLGIDEETIVFFTSDNGGYRLAEEFFQGNGGLRGGKGVLYEGGIRVPMIVRWPGKVRAGATDDFVWAFWDVMPTLAELAGAQAPQGIDGVSVAPRLLGREQAPPDRILYWEIIRQGDGRPWSQALRWKDWKAVRPRGNLPLEVYDLANDRSETNNVADSRPEITKRLADLLKAARTPPRSYPQEEPSWGYERTKTGYVK